MEDVLMEKNKLSSKIHDAKKQRMFGHIQTNPNSPKNNNSV